MECRLCLNSLTPSENFVSIHDDPQTPYLVQRIWTCCHIQIKKEDSLPDIICHSCVNTLKLFNNFRNTCLRNDRATRSKSNEDLNIKHEEILLDDLVWKTESDINLTSSSNLKNITKISNMWNNEIELKFLEIYQTEPILWEPTHRFHKDKTKLQDAWVRISKQTGFPIDELKKKKISLMATFRGHIRDINTSSKSGAGCDEVHKPSWFAFKLMNSFLGHLYKCKGTVNQIYGKQINLHDRPKITDDTVKELHLIQTSNKNTLFGFNSNQNKSFTDEVKTKKISNNPKLQYKCVICSKSFTKNSRLSAHMTIHNGVKPHKCNICKKSFSQKSHLVVHMNIHTGIKPHKCDICLKSFNQKSKLVIHMSVHTGKKPYKCDICFKTFTHKYRLSVHTNIHSGEKPYKCEICLKSFTYKYHLVGHMSVHPGEKPHKCNICSKSFNHKSQLVGHMSIHPGEKPYKCDICSKSYTKKSRLSAHMTIHTGVKPYKCDICSKSFTKKSHLSAHMTIHTGIKPFKCDICKKSFSQKSQLVVHMSIHTGLKPHKCDVCFKSYIKIFNLTRHMTIHNRVKSHV